MSELYKLAVAVKVVSPSNNPIMKFLETFTEYVPTWIFTMFIAGFFMWLEYKFHPKSYKKTAITLVSVSSGFLVILLVGISG